MSNQEVHNFKIFVFRAIDEPELCEKYIIGHRKVLTDYGITNVSTNNSDWVKHQYIYCAVAEDVLTKQLVGGVRIQISDGIHPLPVESAVGSMDGRIYDKVKAFALKGGISESCGLWTDKCVKGIGIARYLMRASISSANQLGFNIMMGICGWHTLKLFNEIGFVVDKSLGTKGDFPYPTDKHIANVIGILDAVNLKNSSESEKQIMFAMRRELKFMHEEKVDNKTIVVNYNIKYPKITAGPFLTNANYNLIKVKGK